MKDLFKDTMKIAGLVFGIVLVVFTGTQTYQLLYSISGSHITAAIGLVLFEVGLLYWWFVFQKDAEGLMQMAISLIMFVVCLLLVTSATALNLGAVEETILGSDTPAKIITIAALLQLAAKLIYPLVEPERFRLIMEKAQEGKILAATHRRFEDKIDEIAEELSNELADEWLERSRLNIGTKWRRQITAGKSNPTPASNFAHDVKDGEPTVIQLSQPKTGQGDNGTGRPNVGGRS